MALSVPSVWIYLVIMDRQSQIAAGENDREKPITTGET